MDHVKSIIERLQSGEKIKCLDCKKSYYITNAYTIEKSREFYCKNCGSAIRITPNITVV